mmetsp:Transcript_99289/g.318536  ORF Transcript_99289/g.318536 Transcript_99289/m.318536 type:complete len:265 (-) Transcript_99289:408-1202(-)
MRRRAQHGRRHVFLEAVHVDHALVHLTGQVARGHRLGIKTRRHCLRVHLLAQGVHGWRRDGRARSHAPGDVDVDELVVHVDEALESFEFEALLRGEHQVPRRHRGLGGHAWLGVGLKSWREATCKSTSEVRESCNLVFHILLLRHVPLPPPSSPQPTATDATNQEHGCDDHTNAEAGGIDLCRWLTRKWTRNALIAWWYIHPAITSSLLHREGKDDLVLELHHLDDVRVRDQRALEQSPLRGVWLCNVVREREKLRIVRHRLWP